MPRLVYYKNNVRANDIELYFVYIDSFEYRIREMENTSSTKKELLTSDIVFLSIYDAVVNALLTFKS